MVQFRPGSHVAELVTLLSFVGEFPFQSLDMLGSKRVYKALIVKEALIKSSTSGGKVVK